ncbi:hypothetical protein [Streptomyces smaragdinus]|uniref:hypothetical protein n=1 Tax=Streptomyces smaragdinus TaxID=2585196 RepID=UPI0012964EF6|nr:hypothetical protein [Streptomyces smaragdinus]
MKRMQVAILPAALTSAILFFSYLLFSQCSPLMGADRDDAVGVWRNEMGGELEFDEDGTFFARGVTLSGEICQSKRAAGSKLELTSGAGSWKMDQPRDENPGILITFKPEGTSSESCKIWALFAGEGNRSEIYLRHEDGEGIRYHRVN